MDRETANVLAASFIHRETLILESGHRELIEQMGGEGGSTKPWADVDKSKLPAGCFLWVEDPKKKSTWHLPYREGTGGIDTETGMYKQAGPINLNALRAIAAAVAGARTGKPMELPAEIRAKIKKLLKRYKIGEKQEASVGKNGKREIIERAQAGMFAATELDKEACVLRNIAVLGPTSINCSFQGGKGRRFAEQARSSAARLINGMKSYRNHQVDGEKASTGGVRKIEDMLGYFENGRYDAGKQRVFADLHYLKYQPIKEWLEAIVEQMPDKVGMSIHAFGQSVYDEAERMEDIVDLEEIRSADLVTDPGSTRNLFEARQPEGQEAEAAAESDGTEVEELEINDLTLAFIRENRPDLLAAHAKELAEDQKTKGEIDALKAKMDAQAKTIDEQAKRLDIYELTEKVGKREKQILALIEESKIPKEYVSEVFMVALRSAKDDETVKALLEDRRKTVEGLKRGVRGMGAAADTTPVSDEDAAKEYHEAVKG